MNRSQPRILMCRPTHYGIEYEINPWMKRERSSDRGLALEQWERLVALLRAAGAEIDLIEPVAGLPDMVFTANAGVVFGELFVSSRFLHGQRQGESEHFERWFTARGYQVVGLSVPAAFEGAGDALFCGEALFAGYRHRSEIQAHQRLARLLGREVLGLELVDPRFYHLDTCFCPLDPWTALYFPAAFDEYGRRVLEENVPRLVAVGEAEAIRFGCNAVVVGRSVILNTGCEELAEKIESLEFSPRPTPLGEFLKSGGSAKCLTLRLDGEEAAVW